MRARKLIFLISLLLFAAVASALSQNPGTAVAQLPAAPEPYFVRAGTSFSASGRTSKTADPMAATRHKIVNELSEALEMVRGKYVGKTIDGKLMNSVIDGSLRALDPHSNYFDQAEFSTFLDDKKSEYSGIGATIATYEKDGKSETYVLSTVPGSSSRIAGLRFGDKIKAVNGEPVSGQNAATVRDKVRGPKDSTVRITIERGGTKTDEKTISLRRGFIPQPSIPNHYILRDGIGYVGITQGFNYTTADEFKTILRGLRKQGMTSLIVDLRGNTGGIVEQAVGVAEQLLPDGNVIVSQRGRSTIDDRVWRSTNRAPEAFPVVLLVDRDTASASEIVAGALQDHDRALIIGERTFGKGLVQNVINLPHGGGLTLTAARYYTPSGRSIQRDYSAAGYYDYFKYDGQPAESTGPEARTDSKRIVRGGNGIQPDELLPSAALTAQQLRLLDPIFFFSKEFVDGAPPDMTIGDKPDWKRILAAFNAFVARDASWNIDGDTINSSAGFILTRITYNLAIANRAEAVDRLLSNSDPHVKKAIELLPQAAALALGTVPQNYRGKQSNLIRDPLLKTKRSARSNTDRAVNKQN